jgi:hypothetical protein
VQRKSLVTIGACTALLCGLSGFAHHPQISWQDQSSATAIPETDSQTAEPVDEEPAEAGIPHEIDVAASLDRFQKLIDQADKVMLDLKTTHATDATEATANWQKALDAWEQENNYLIKRCELWLGADGTETYSSLSLSCENLTRGSEWLRKSMAAASSNNYSKSKIYFDGAEKAIKKARAVLHGTVNPARRNAIVKTPKNIRALEKSALEKSALKKSALEKCPIKLSNRIKINRSALISLANQ